jgi:hypothetical protein
MPHSQAHALFEGAQRTAAQPDALPNAGTRRAFA